NKSKKPQMSEMLQQMQEEELTEQQLIHKVNKLSRQPIKCPISNCAETIFPTSMLMHMCHKHAPYTVHAEMYDHLPLTLSFGPAEMAKDEVKCVATLLYGGIKDRAETQPGRTYMSMPNVDHFDSRDDARLKHYLPVMLLACRTTW
ncbi:CG15472, partial [Drosophila busckii]